jgi:hypothetical protein
MIKIPENSFVCAFSSAILLNKNGIITSSTFTKNTSVLIFEYFVVALNMGNPIVVFSICSKRKEALSIFKSRPFVVLLNNSFEGAEVKKSVASSAVCI